MAEINCTPRLVEALRARLPGCELVFSTTTDTGFARAVTLYGGERVFRFPLDFSPVIGRALRRIRPSLIVLVELEVWYNLTRIATGRGIPVAVVNGRLTARSLRRFQWLGPAARRMFQCLAWVGAQDDAIAERFKQAGVPADRIETTSSLKWDTAVVADRIKGDVELARAMGLDHGRPLWVCGSTGPGEEAMILTQYGRLLEQWASLGTGAPERHANPERMGAPILAMVPRKPERFDEVANLIERSGYTCIRRSRQVDGTHLEATDRPAVLLGDTMGELRKFYSLCDVAFVGRSLVPMGGSDPIEAAALGCAIVVGPHCDNFRLPVEALCCADALRVVHEPDALAATVGELLHDPASARALGARAKQVVLDHRGATSKTADRLVGLLNTVDG